VASCAGCGGTGRGTGTGTARVAGTAVAESRVARRAGDRRTCHQRATCGRPGIAGRAGGAGHPRVRAGGGARTSARVPGVARVPRAPGCARRVGHRGDRRPGTSGTEPEPEKDADSCDEHDADAQDAEQRGGLAPPVRTVIARIVEFGGVTRSRRCRGAEWISRVGVLRYVRRRIIHPWHPGWEAYRS
jgi:hypothetical protein